jgi:hypothetical protein
LLLHTSSWSSSPAVACLWINRRQVGICCCHLGTWQMREEEKKKG